MSGVPGWALGWGLAGFSFPIKFGWCSVLGKDEKLVFDIVGVWFAAAQKKMHLGGN